MAKITLTFEDNADGTVDITMDCDPPTPLNLKVEDQTPAQNFAAVALDAIGECAGDPS